MNFSALRKTNELDTSALVGNKTDEGNELSSFDLFDTSSMFKTQSSTPQFSLKSDKINTSALTISRAKTTPKSARVILAERKAEETAKEAEKGTLFAGFKTGTKELATEIGQSISRNIASFIGSEALSSITDPITRKIAEVEAKSPTFKLFTDELSSRLYGDLSSQDVTELTGETRGEQISPLGERFVGIEERTKSAGKEYEELAQTPGLNARERFIASSMGEILQKQSSNIAFVALTGYVGLDLTPWGGGKKGVTTAIKQVDNLGDAMKLLTKMGVADDLVQQFAPEVVRIKSSKEATKLLDNILNVQSTTRVAEGTKTLEPLAQEARKYNTAEEFVNKMYVEPSYDLTPGVTRLTKQKTTGLYHGTSPEAIQGILDTGKIEAKITKLDKIGQKSVSVTGSRGVAGSYGNIIFELDPTLKVIEPPAGAVKGDYYKGFEFRHTEDIPTSKIKSAFIDIGKAESLDTKMIVGWRGKEPIYKTIGEIKGQLEAKGIKTYVADFGDKSQLTDIFNRAKGIIPKELKPATIQTNIIDDIAKTYTVKAPEKSFAQKSVVVRGAEVPVKVARGIELPYVWFERKGLSQVYDPIIEAGRAKEIQLRGYLSRFENAGLFKKGSWFTADRFLLSGTEKNSIGKYYLARQGKGGAVALTDLSPKAQKFVSLFDGIIKETEPRFFDVARKMGKSPNKVADYAPLMTKEDIVFADKGGASDWLFNKHPAFFSLKERAKKVPLEVYELDYSKVATRWLEGVTDFLNYSETTSDLKRLIDSDQFKKAISGDDQKFIGNWLKNITTPDIPVTEAAEAITTLSRLLRRGVAMGSLGLNYASVLKQALTQVPVMVISRARPKLKSKYAEAFGINVADMPSITKRSGDIAIQDLQGKLGRVFTGPLTKFDRQNAQVALAGFLDKGYERFLKEGVEITPEIQRVIEKNAQDMVDMWFGGFFKGQRPEFFRKEVGNLILMFLYPLTSQLNGFYRHILTAKGVGKVGATAEVLAAMTAIAYMEQVIENLSPQWSDEVGMTRDVFQSLAGNIPVLSDITYALLSDQEIQVSPVVGQINNILRKFQRGEGRAFSILETVGLPKQVRRITEGMEILEKGGVRDKSGKMLAPVQETMEYVRAFLRGKYGPIASQDWVRNIGEKIEDRRWFVPQVEFLQNGDYGRKAELYRQFTKIEQEELRAFLSEAQQKKLDKALEKLGAPTSKRSLEEIFGGGQRKSLEEIFK